jgi:dihydrofolate reductase
VSATGSGFRASAFIATSLDGFIARPGGEIDWLPAGEDDGEDYGYARFMSSVDALVMGRASFDKVLSFDAWPYGDTPVIVLTRRHLEVPPGLAATVTASADPPERLATDLPARGIHHVYADGGITIGRFIRACLLDEIVITRIPVLIGEGIPLFGTVTGDVPLEHLTTTAYPSGLVQSTYRFAYAGPAVHSAR